MSSDGTRVAIGALPNDGRYSAGYARIYEYADGSWKQLGDDSSGKSGGDWSGKSVSISSDGTRVAIGAPWSDGGGYFSGYARIHEYVDGLWKQLRDDIDGESTGEGSGWSVSMSSDGTRVAIGATGNCGLGRGGYFAGYVRIHEYVDGSSWRRYRW